jgi:hypothetical protein
MSTPSHDDSRLHDGIYYSVNHLVGVLRDGQEAERVAQRLHEAGFTDVVVLDGRLGLETLQIRESAAGPLTRAWERLSVYLAGETDDREAALAALDKGHAIVMVYARPGAQEDKAERILQAHNARGLIYFGRWTITHVSP